MSRRRRRAVVESRSSATWRQPQDAGEEASTRVQLAQHIREEDRIFSRTDTPGGLLSSGSREVRFFGGDLPQNTLAEVPCAGRRTGPVCFVVALVKYEL
jgi:hypothetical protein